MMKEAEVIHRLPAVMKLSGKGRTQLMEDVKAGRFPAPVRIGLRAIGWKSSSIRQWQDGLPTTTQGA